MINYGKEDSPIYYVVKVWKTTKSMEDCLPVYPKDQTPEALDAAKAKAETIAEQAIKSAVKAQVCEVCDTRQRIILTLTNNRLENTWTE